MDKRANDVGEPADGRRRSDQAAHRRLIRVVAHFRLPASDCGGSEPEEPSDLRLRETEKFPETQDAVSKLRRVMRSARLVDLVQMLSEDVCDVLKGAKKDFIELGLAESSLQWFRFAPSLCDLETEGQTEQSLGVEQGAYGARRQAPALSEGLKSSLFQNVRIHLRRHIGTSLDAILADPEEERRLRNQ